MEREEGRGEGAKEKAMEYVEETYDLLAYFSYRLGYLQCTSYEHVIEKLYDILYTRSVLS